MTLLTPPKNDAPARLLSIAIDESAGAGKSTVARHLAQALAYTYIDTGAMYRALAWSVLKHGIDPGDVDTVVALAERIVIHLEPGATDECGTRVTVDGIEITDKIRTPAISSLTSPLSAIPGVRHRMVDLQKKLGAAGGVVMEGRDIGTVVLPNADIKVFLTATSEKRAQRRQGELAQRGLDMPFATLIKEIEERDTRDATRDIALWSQPMTPKILDSDHMTADEVVAQILEWHKETAAGDVS